MPRMLPLIAGVTAGLVIARERRRRDRSERLAAAVLETLLRAIDANDAETGKHVRRVASYALVLAHAARVSRAMCRSVERVALFHDVGKIDEALFDLIHDPNELSPDERRAVMTHPARGAAVLEPLSTFYPKLGPGVLAHHERWDGGGYPRHLSEKNIPFEARVVSIADTFDVITHGRRYSTARGMRVASDVIASGRATQFDPSLVDVFLTPRVQGQLATALSSDSVPRPRTRRSADEASAPDIPFRWRTITAPRADDVSTEKR